MDKRKRLHLWEGDCLEMMKNIPDDSVDLVLIDPPYNIGKDKRWDKWKTVSGYISFMGSVFTECERVLKENGSFYFFHNDFLQIVELQNWLNENSGLKFKQLITWNKIKEDFKNIGYVKQRLSIEGMRNYYGGFTEYCLYYTFQDETGRKKVDYDVNNYRTLREYSKSVHQFIGLKKKEIINILGNQKTVHFFQYAKNNKQFSLPTKSTYKELIEVFNINEMDGFRTYESLREEYESQREEYESQRYTFETQQTSEDLRTNSNVWLYPPAPNIGHPTSKPVDLLENILKHSSNENDTVLDCFMGSGSTGVASKNLKRKFIGIEKDPKYFNIAKDRIRSS